MHFWLWKGQDAIHDRLQKQKTFLVEFLLNEVISTILSKYNGPSGSGFVFVPLFKLSKFSISLDHSTGIFTIISRVFQ